MIFKKYYLTIFYFLLFSIFFFGCKKDEDLLRNKNWVLQDAKVYIEELDNGNKKYYNHFGSGKDTSSLNLDGGITETDTIIKGSTIWHFGDNSFTLNNNLVFDIENTKNNVRVYGLRNGSAMIIQLQKVNEVQLEVKVGETVENINGENVSYFSILNFIAQ